MTKQQKDALVQQALNASKSGKDLTWTWEKQKSHIANNMQDLKLNTGKVLGKITSAGYKAIENNTLDSYTPFNEEEKKTIEAYKNYLSNPISKGRGPIETKNYGAVTQVETNVAKPQNDKSSIDTTITPKNKSEVPVETADGTFGGAIATKAKQALQNVGSSLRDSFMYLLGMQMEQSKYDPSILTLNEDKKNAYHKEADKIVSSIDTKIKDTTTAQQQKFNNEWQKYSNLPKWQQITAELVGGSAQLIPQMAISAIDPGTGMAMLGAQVLGGSYGEALSEGADRYNASLYAVTSAATEIGIEKAFGGIPLMGKGIFNDQITKGVSKLISNPTTQKTLKYIIDSVGEGGEEVASTFLTPYIKKFTYDPNAEAPTVEDYLMSFGGGLVGSALFGGGGLALELNLDTQHKLEQKEYLESKIANTYNKYFESAAVDEANGSESTKTAQLKIQLDREIEDLEALNKKIKKSVSPSDMSKIQSAATKLGSMVKQRFNALKTTIGDKFKDKKTGNVFTITDRNDEKTVVEIETPKGTETREFTNGQLDSVVESGQVEKIMSAESEADELMATDMSEDETVIAETTPVTERAEATTVNVTPTVEETSYVEKTTPTKTVTPQTTSYNVKAGDIYKNNYTGTTYTVVERDAENTTIIAENEQGNRITDTTPNAKFDTIFSNPQTTIIKGNPIVQNAVAPNNVATPQVQDVNNVVVAENTTTTEVKNEVVTEENATNGKEHSKAFKRGENGEIRFNQTDIDYNNNSMRKGQFKIVSSLTKDAVPETVDGWLCGKYGIHKSSKSNKQNVVLLTLGMKIKSFDTLTEAKKYATYLNENLSFNDVTYKQGLSGDFYVNKTDELMQYVADTNDIFNNKTYETTTSTATEIENGKVPFNTKAGLINYVKSHIGDKVKVTFNNGTSDIRLLDGISNTNLKTKYVTNGSVSNAELKGVKFNDTGFSIDFKNGVVVTYDFVNVSDNTETDTVKKISEETLEERRNEIREKAAKTGEINLDELGTLTGIPVTHMSKETETVKEVSENFDEVLPKDEVSGRIENTKKSDNINESTGEDNGDNREYDSIGETQLRENEKAGIHREGNQTDFVGDTKYTDRTQGENHPNIEKKYNGKSTNEEVIRGVFHGTPYQFSKHTKSYVDLGIHYGTEEQAKNRLADNRGNIIQADLTLNNPLVTADIFGERTPKQYVDELIENSELSENEKNKLINNFNDFVLSDIESIAAKSLNEKLTAGSHRIITRVDESGIYISLAIVDEASNTNEIPLTEFIDKDKLVEIIGVTETAEVITNGIVSEKAADMLAPHLFETIIPFENRYLQLRKIEEILQSFGYDGFAYHNENEGQGWSYAVFDDSQIMRVEDNSTLKNKESAEDVHERVLDRESGNDSAVRKSEPVQEVEEKRNVRTEDREFGEDVTSKNGTHIQDAEGKTPSERPNDSRDNDNGIRESDNSDGDSGIGVSGNDNVNDEVTNETETEKESKAKDYSITKAVAEELDTKSPNIDDNIKAIETLHELEKSGKAPTKTQQSILAKFKGWGGLSNAFWSARNRLKEIMSDNEISAAQSTVNDAYFTPTTIIDSIYKGLSHLGFEGGNILEPSMGVGNFFGKMPKSIKDVSSLFGVEIDSISGRIAQYLYPSANIEVAPFQDVAYKDNSFDLIIGNVPFGEVKYKYKSNKYLIHDYFFVKAMDKLNDGGIMVFLTSKGTLDKLDSTTRAELNRQGNIIGAYRLPSNVFSRSAGANVVTDLIIMQKTTNKNGEKFVNTGSVKLGNENFSINEYFVNHPENIIGELTYRRGQYGKYELTVQSTGDVSEQLTKAIRKLPKNLLSGVQTVGTTSVMENDAKLQTFYINDKGNVEYVDAQTGEVKELKNTVKSKNNDIAKEYLAIKKAYTELADYTLNDAETSTIESKRKELNTLYDGFVKKHGTLEKNKKLLSADNDFYKLSGLEVYDTKTKKIIKSEMFSKDTIGKRKPKKADNVLDALSISMGESGTVNLKRISELTNLPIKEVTEQLSDRIIYTPDGNYELNEVYLSGNVREKYEAVKGKKGFEKNEQMLKAVIPEDIPAKDIVPQFGASWIEPKYVAEFLRDTFQLRSTPKVVYDATTGTWSITSSWGDHTLLTNKYGTKHLDGIQLSEKALNMRQIVVKNKDGVILGTETKAAQQKALDIKNAFEEWCFKDADRRNDLVETFNRLFNSNRNMDFSELAKYLTFNGLSDTFRLRDYQKRAVARGIFNGNTLLAHGVGTGKTAEMITIAMELKRMGMAKKNMMVVPPHKVADFRNDILKMYPSAKVAMLEKGANATQRQRFYAQVAANDFDIVIIPHSSFGLLDVSKDTKIAFVNNQISELEEVLTAAQLEKGSIDGRFIRQLENQKKRLEEKLKFITESKKDNGNTFDELGVDSLFVDEAHNFKNLPFYTKLSRVAGVSAPQNNNKDRASRAENMFMITDYLNRNNGRITFGTATPITKSMSEIYNMTRFLRPDILRDSGLQSFDAWAAMFGSIVNKAETKPSGRGMRMKERFSKFRNVSQMIEQFRRFADILKSGEVIEDLPVAERINVINPSNEIQEEFLDRLDEIISDIQTNGARSEYNMLQVTKAGEMAALDLRMVVSYFDGKYTLDDLNLPNNRTSQVAERVYKEYTDSNATKGTQFVFCDAGVYDNPDGTYGFHVYGDLINKLVAYGIPRSEIAVAQEFEDKADLSAKVNTGEIRVLIGSTAVMGEGMNAQNKAVALHHMTIPDNPAGLEQREGRIIRYGNENKNVRIYRYIQESSYDSYKWQMQERKADIINQALSGGTVEELEEMSDFQLSAREAKAIASGNPLLLEKIEVEDKITNLKMLRKKFNTDKLEMQERLNTLPNRIRVKEKIIENGKADLKTIEANKTKDFEITLGKTKYTERAKAAEALEKGLSKAPKNGTIVTIGNYRGLELKYSSSIAKGTEFILEGAGKYTVMGGDSALGNITRIMNAVEKISENLSNDEALVNKYKSEITTLEKEVQSEFAQAKELAELETKLNEIDTALGINVSEVDMSDVFVDEDSDDGDAETVHSSRDLSDTDNTNRWNTERIEGGHNTKTRFETAKGKATEIANKAIDTVNKIPGVDIPNVESKSANIADIVKMIKEHFDIPIATGKVTDRKASGIYKEKAESIRTRIANNLPTIFHELGHHLDKLYKLSSKGSIKALRKSISQEFLDQYHANERNGEAVAEFVRTYLKNTEEAKALCPDFYYDFVDALSKDDLKVVDTIANVANEYMASSFSDRVRASIVSGKTKEETTLSEKAKKMHTYWVDGFLPIKDAVEYVEETTGTSLAGGRNAYTLATNSLNARAIANFNAVHGFRDLNGNIVKGAKSFIECIANVDKKHLNTLDEYLVLKHSLEWIAPENKDVTKKRVFADDTLEDVEAIERRIAEIEDSHPEMKKAAENLYEYQRNILKYIVMPAGGMTEDTYNSLNEKYPCYVPFYRAIGKNGAKTKGTFANQKSPLKRAKGSGEQIISPIVSIINNTDKMVKFALRNQTMQVLTSYADSVDGFGKFIEKVPPDMLPHTTDITRLKENFEDELQQVVKSGKDYFAVSELFDELFGNSVTDFTPIANANKKIVTVLKNGQFSYYQVHDDALYDAIAEFTPKQIEGLEWISQKIMLPMKMMITQVNPIFATTNLFRDIGTAYKHSPINNPLEFAKRYALALKEVVTKGDMYKQWQAMGGGHNSELSADLNQIKVTLSQVAQKDMGKARRLVYSIFRHPVATVAAINDYIESVPRTMEFVRTLESGGDLQQAINNADDITTNFKRSGKGGIAKGVNAGVMFNNAALQGLDKTYRTLTNKNVDERNKTLLKWALFALLMAAVQLAWNKRNDDEGYENLSSYKKNNFYNFSIGDGKFISIPKARETALLDSFTERTIELAFGNDEAFYDFGGYLIDQMLPPMFPNTFNFLEMPHDVLGSTVLGGLLDVGYNKNFMDIPIEGTYDQYLPSNERYNENTTKLAYELGQTKLARKTNLSPKKIDHLISSYTGILGQVNKALFPMNKENRDATIGLRNKFISDSNYSTDVLNRLYDNRDATKLEWQYDDNINNAIEYEQNAVITSYVSGMNKAIKALPEDKQRDGRKYLLKTLNEWNYNLTAQQKNMQSRLEDESISKDYIFDELPSSELSWTKDKKKYTYQMTPQEYNEYINVYLNEVENARKNIGGNSLESYAKAKETAKDRMSNYKKNRLIPRYIKKATKSE